MASAKALATVLHLHRGTPYVYQGEELGMTNASFAKIEDYRDIESLNYYRSATAEGHLPEKVRKKSRDHARNPMQWTAALYAGFSEKTPWLPVNADHVSINAESQTDNPDSVFSHYQRLITVRHSDPVAVHGSFTILIAEHPQLYV